MTPLRCSAHPPLLSPPERNDLCHGRVLRLGRCAHCIVLCQLCDVRQSCIRQLRTPPASACSAGSDTIGAMPCRLLHRALRALGMPCPGALRVPPLELRSVLRARRRRRCVLRCTRRPACREARPLCFVRHCARASAARLAHHVSCGPCGTGADAFACGLHSAPWCANNRCTVQLLSTGDYPTVALFPRVLPFDDAPARCEPRLDCRGLHLDEGVGAEVQRCQARPPPPAATSAGCRRGSVSSSAPSRPPLPAVTAA